MAFFSGLISCVGEFLSTAIPAVGDWIANATRTLISKLPEVFEFAANAMNFISSVTSKISERLDIAPANEKLYELGAKAMQEEARPKIDTETTQEYLDYLRKDVDFDENKFSKMPETEKLACEALGTTLVAKSVEEKTGVEIPPEFLYTIYKSKIGYERAEKFIHAFSDNGIKSMGEFSKYISNDMSELDANVIDSVVRKALKEINPKMSDEDIQNEIINMKQEYFSEDK